MDVIIDDGTYYGNSDLEKLKPIIRDIVSCTDFEEKFMLVTHYLDTGDLDMYDIDYFNLL